MPQVPQGSVHGPLAKIADLVSQLGPAKRPRRHDRLELAALGLDSSADDATGGDSVMLFLLHVSMGSAACQTQDRHSSAVTTPTAPNTTGERAPVAHLAARHGPRFTACSSGMILADLSVQIIREHDGSGL
jgi:hypothetical protein